MQAIQSSVQRHETKSDAKTYPSSLVKANVLEKSGLNGRDGDGCGACAGLGRCE